MGPPEYCENCGETHPPPACWRIDTNLEEMQSKPGSIERVNIAAELTTLKQRQEQLEGRLAELDKADEEAEREKFCVRVVCRRCIGRGDEMRIGPSDNTDVYYEHCEECDGRGWVWALQWVHGRAVSEELLQLDERDSF